MFDKDKYNSNVFLNNSSMNFLYPKIIKLDYISSKPFINNLPRKIIIYLYLKNDISENDLSRFLNFV